MKRFLGFGLILSLTVLTAFFAACSNPSGPSGSQNVGDQNGGGPVVTPNPPSDDFTSVLPGNPGATVREQLEWLQTEAVPGEEYVVWARLPNEEISGIWTGNLAVDNNITVRIRSYGSTTPPPRRVLTLDAPGTMLDIGANTLILYDIDLAGLPGNTNPQGNSTYFN